MLMYGRQINGDIGAVLSFTLGILVTLPFFIAEEIETHIIAGRQSGNFPYFFPPPDLPLLTNFSTIAS